MDKRGSDTNITMGDIEKAAEGEGMSVEDTVREMIDGFNEGVKQLQKENK